MSTIETVLCPIDFSDLTERSVKLAVEICRRADAKLILEHNVESWPPTNLSVGWMWSERHEAEAHDKSETAIHRIAELFDTIPTGVEYEAKLTRGPIDKALLHVAKTLPAGLIVMGTHGPSSSAHESLTEKIIIRAPCTVLTLGESYRPESVFGLGKDDPNRMCMLVPYDFSARARACLDNALAMAHRMPHRIHLLHVIDHNLLEAADSQASPEVSAMRDELRSLIPDEFAARMSVDVVTGDPAQQIVKVARDIDALFILMPAHGKSLLKRFIFGSTTLEVLHSSDCPVWFMSEEASRHPPDWATA